MLAFVIPLQFQLFPTRISLFMYIRSSDWQQETAFLRDLSGIPVLTEPALNPHRSELHQHDFWEESLDEQHGPWSW